MYETEPVVDDLLSILKNEVHNRKNKNVEVLQLAENITRRMNGMLIKAADHPIKSILFVILPLNM